MTFAAAPYATRPWAALPNASRDDHTLAAQSTAHGHGVDSVTFTQVHDLTVGSSAHSHMLSTSGFLQVHDLTVGSSAHSHMLSTSGFLQVHFLDVHGAIHRHTAVKVNFAVSLQSGRRRSEVGRNIVSITSGNNALILTNRARNRAEVTNG